MKKRILLFIAVAGVSSLVFSSYTNGPGLNGYDCTGAETGLGNPTGCSTGSGCHGGLGAATTGITVGLELDSSGTAVTHYVPGHVYTIKITGTNTTSNVLPKFGFQISAIKGSTAVTTPVNAGTFATSGLPAHVQYSPALPGNYVANVVEHNTQIPATTGSGGSGTTYVESISWTAPAAGTGTVSLWGAVNAVNGDGLEGAEDKWNTAHTVLTEIAGPTGVANVTANVSFSVYPNPVSNVLNVQAEGNYSMQIFDLNGRVVANENIAGNAVVNTINWTAGIYYVIMSNENGVRSVTAVVKQ